MHSTILCLRSISYPEFAGLLALFEQVPNISPSLVLNGVSSMSILLPRKVVDLFNVSLTKPV